MDDNLNLVPWPLYVKQLGDSLIIAPSRLVIDLDDLLRILAAVEIRAFKIFLDLPGILCIRCDHKHERLHLRLSVLEGIFRESGLCGLMHHHRIRQLLPVKVVCTVRVVVFPEVLPPHDRRLLHKTIRPRLCKPVFAQHIPEWPVPHPWCGGHLNAQNRLQCRDCLRRRTCTVVMCLIHQHHKVIPPLEVVKVALPYSLVQTTDFGDFLLCIVVCIAPFIKLLDVEYVYCDGMPQQIPFVQQARPALVGIPRNDHRLLRGKAR